MNRICACVFCLLFVFTADSSAQKKEVASIEWKIAGVLPAPKDQMQSLGVAGPVAGVHNNVLFVAGGANFPDAMPWLGGKKKYYRDGFVFQKKNDSLIFFKSFQLPSSLAYSANVSTADGVLAIGGENENGISTKVLLLQWNEAANDVVIKSLPELPFAVTNASAAVNNEKIFVAGGERANDVSDQLLVLDLKNYAAGWQSLSFIPNAVSHAVLVAQSNGSGNYLYLLGGRKRNSGSTSDLYQSTLRFDITANQWTEKKNLPYTLSAGTAVAAGNNILLFGGDAGETFHKSEEIIAAIGKETDEVKKQKLNEEKAKVQSSHPGFCRQVLLYDTEKNKWKKLDCIPFDAPVTTTAIQWDGDVVIPSGEIRAGVRTPNLLSGKLTVKNSAQK